MVTLFRTLCVVVSAGWIGLASLGSAAAQELVPFRIPWNDASSGPTDRAGVLDPATFLPLTVGADGHLYRGGERFRLWGMNFGFDACFPEHEHADRVSARLAKLGFNIVRLHGCDAYFGTYGGNTLIDYGTAASNGFDADALDRFDYFVGALRQRGIYVDLNLHVARRFLPGDSPDTDDPLQLPEIMEGENWTVIEMDEHKVLAMFVDRVTAAERAFARELLGHLNPYTGFTYAQDPAVAIVEILNEAGLVHFWLWNRLDGLPAPFLEELRAKWNDWLVGVAGYADTEELALGWGNGAAPVELLVNPELAMPLDPWVLQATAPAVASASADPTADGGSPALRIDVTDAGTESWHVQMFQPGIALLPGETYAVRLRARASSPRPVHLDVRLDGDPWTAFTPWVEDTLTTEWQDLVSTFTVPDDATPSAVRFEIGSLGLESGSVWVSRASFEQGATVLEPQETLEASTIPIIAFDSPRAWSRAARRDWLAFLRDTELAYYQSMTSTLRDELGVQALISGSQVITSLPSVQASLDLVDNHAYWDHPYFPVVEWDPVNWSITNTSAVDSPPGIFATLASGRVEGKPYIVSETNHLFPNTHAGEGPLLTAAYAALHDFDGVFFFQWVGNNDFDHTTFTNFSDGGYHAPHLANLTAAANLFQQFHGSAAVTTYSVALDAERELDAIIDRGQAWHVVDARSRGFPPLAALLGKVALDLAPGAVDSPVPDLAGLTRFGSDTGELDWDVASGVVTIDTERTRAVIGHTDGGQFLLGGPGVDCTSDPASCVGFGLGVTRRNFSTLALSLVEGDSFADDGRALLAATGDVENSDMVWTDASRTSVADDWGRAPTLIEVIPAIVTIPRPASEVRVFALDGRGQRAAELPVTGDPATFEIGQDLDTLWYEVALGAVSDPSGQGESSLEACAGVCDVDAAACGSPRRDCVSACSRFHVELLSGSCDCAAAATELLNCAHGEADALSCSELPLGIDPDGGCADELFAAEFCRGATLPCTPLVPEPIDDFEDGDGTALHSGFGDWVLDGDAATELEPRPFLPSAGGVHESSGSGRVEGTVVEWAHLRLDARGIDLSGYAGIGFFARGRGRVRFSVQSRTLTEVDNFDAHGMDMKLESEWRYHSVRFDDPDFEQAGWGEAQAFDPRAIDQLQFQHERGPWSLEIDDVALLRDPTLPPDGTGGVPGMGAAGSSGAGGSGEGGGSNLTGGASGDDGGAGGVSPGGSPSSGQGGSNGGGAAGETNLSGASGTGGASGNGGAESATAGADGASDAGLPEPARGADAGVSGPGDGGCGCRLTARSVPRDRVLFALLAGILLAGVRRGRGLERRFRGLI